MSIYRIVLPFPPAKLTPHAKGGWRQKAALTKMYRRACAGHATAQGLRRIEAKGIKARITLHRPNLRRDYQNCISCFKAGVDGLADIAGIDDRKWKIDFVDGEVERPHGRVVVELEAA